MFRIFPLFISLAVMFTGAAYAQMNTSAPRYVAGTSTTTQPTTDRHVHSSEWQMTLDEIKSKAQELVATNTALLNEYESLKRDQAQIKKSSGQLRVENEKLKSLLADRRGRTNQQMRVEEVNSLNKIKMAEVAELKAQLSVIQKAADDLDRKNQLKRLKLTDIQLHHSQETLEATAQKAFEDHNALDNDEEISSLKERLAKEKAQEDFLESQRSVLKQSNPIIESIDDKEILELQSKVEILRKQKEDLQNAANVDNSQTQATRFKALLARKTELEEKIRKSEVLLNQLKDPVARGIGTAQQKKQVVQQMIQLENKNARMRQKIADLKDDVKLLREHVVRLERKISTASRKVDFKK